MCLPAFGAYSSFVDVSAIQKENTSIRQTKEAIWLHYPTPSNKQPSPKVRNRRVILFGIFDAHGCY